jgi:hypothetical protein
VPRLQLVTQTLPQEPQFLLSEKTFVQAAAQQASLPMAAVPQALPHLPQLLMSVDRSVHAAAQQPGVVPVVQVEPQRPQLLVSVERFEQTPEQQPGVLDGELHRAPQVPQLFTSFLRSAQ